MTNEHTSLEKYTSHTLFSKGLRKVYVWEVSWRRNRLPHIDPPKFLCIISALLPHSAGLLNRGPESPSPLSGANSHYGISLQLRLELEPWVQLKLNSACLGLQLTQTACGTRLYDCLTSTCFLWASQLHRIQPVHRSRWYPDIFDRMHLLFTQVHLLIDSSVEGQYVTAMSTYVWRRRGLLLTDCK